MKKKKPSLVFANMPSLFECWFISENIYGIMGKVPFCSEIWIDAILHKEYEL